MIQIAAIVAAVLVSSLALQSWRLGLAHDEIKNMQAAQVSAALAESESARIKSSALLRATEGNARDIDTKLRSAVASAAAARRDLDGVRESASALAAAAAAHDPGPAGCPDDGRLGRVLGLLAESAGLAAEGAERVDRLAAEKAGLQRHQSEVVKLLVK